MRLVLALDVLLDAFLHFVVNEEVVAVREQVRSDLLAISVVV